MAQTTTILFAIITALASARAAVPQVDASPEPAAVLDNDLLFFRTRAGEPRKAEWAAKAARARQASADVAAAALLGLRSARPADFEIVRGTFPAVSDACTACHRAFAREAPVIKP
jgi:hypothetical protein